MAPDLYGFAHVAGKRTCGFALQHKRLIEASKAQAAAVGERRRLVGRQALAVQEGAGALQAQPCALSVGRGGGTSPHGSPAAHRLQVDDEDARVLVVHQRGVPTGAGRVRKHDVGTRWRAPKHSRSLQPSRQGAFASLESSRAGC